MISMRTHRKATAFTRHRTAVALLAVSLLAPTTAACADTDSAAAARSASPAPTEVRLSLPRPSGPHRIGRDTLHLVDEARRDPWVPSTGARELMVSVFYPARRDDNDARAPYLATKEAALLLKGQKLDQRFDAEQLTSVHTNARLLARAAPGRHPLVALSPGFTLHRATLTGLAESLASRGHIVAVVDHAYESYGTEFPDEKGSARMRTCVACEKVGESPSTGTGENKVLAAAARNRAEDLSFVVDELTAPSRRDDGRHPDYAALIDPRRIGAAGHSLGGNAAAVAIGTDPRIRAAANVDGTFFAPVPSAGTSRPVLMLGTDKKHHPRADDTTWLREWRRLDGWKRWFTVAGSGHFTFTDLPVLSGQLGMTDPSAPLSGTRSGQITNGYVTAFFDRNLLGRHRPLLDGPSKADPEVAFHSP
ncbi:alpha/beta hydrolase [Streptomyces sp. NPDC052114]|uniref:alpha/beta hydrolase family protein n=1 Tax=unclassified Streptomyces TaxID=2593676 RepID=UPI00343BD1CF